MIKRTFFFALVFSGYIFSNDLFFSAPDLSGSGCPSGTVDFALAPNNKSLSILFNQFSLAGSQHKACQVLIPISVEGEVFSYDPMVIQSDYRGFYDLPNETMLSQQVTYRLGNGEDFSKIDSAYGPATVDYIYSHQPSIICNGTQILRLLVQSALIGSPDGSYYLTFIDLATAATPDFSLELCSSGASSIVFSPWVAFASLFLWISNLNLN